MTYQNLIQKIKDGEKIDYYQLRVDYTKNPNYKPNFRDPNIDAGQKAVLNNDYQKAIAIGQAILETNYICLSAYSILSRAYKNSNDPDNEIYHQIFKGLLDSILNKGNGQDIEHAYEAVTLEEEYVSLAILQKKVSRQALIKSQKGQYDQLEVVDFKTNKPETIYFCVNRMFKN